ncbi:PLAT domain-containing protein 1-like [Silene latifolia]|uniref:PLAT domain-containing protein 1-like n=2 Tax=Silene latifolia TaxID=37657 RepID=UPI003D774E4B
MASCGACLNALMFMLLLSFACVAHSDRGNCVYSIYVKTADETSAGTDAKVNLKLYDNQGNMVEIADLELFGLMPKGHNYFEPNNLDAFAIRTKCLANLICKIELSHDNTGDNPAWKVDYVDVTTAVPQIYCTTKDFDIDDIISPIVVRDTCGGVKESVLKMLDLA